MTIYRYMLLIAMAAVCTAILKDSWQDYKDAKVQNVIREGMVWAALGALGCGVAGPLARWMNSL